MSFIVGYKAPKKKRNFFIITTIVLAVLLLAIFWIASLEIKKEKEPVRHKKTATGVKREKLPAQVKKRVEKKPKYIGKAKVLQQATSRSIKNHVANDVASEFAQGEIVYYCTKVMIETIPQTIKHVWINPDGKVYASINLDIVHQPANTWSRITLPPASEGEWLVRVVVGEKIVDESKFKVKQ